MTNSINKIKTIFMGTPNFAVPILESLIKLNYIDVNTVITQPDKEVGRKKILTPPPVKIIAEKYDIKVLQPDKINHSEFEKILEEIKPELIVVAAYGKILPKNIIDMPKYHCINIHTSLLPKYRGASPIQNAIINGDKETGITIMIMDEKMDTGDIISQAKINIENDDTSESLHKKLAQLGADLLIKILPSYLQGQIKTIPQNNSLATKTKIITKNDGEINFTKTAEKIEKTMRAYTPWPGIYTFFNNKKIKLLKLKIEEQINPLIPKGKLYEAENNLMINCSENALVIEQIQVEGKNIMSGKEFINGYLR